MPEIIIEYRDEAQHVVALCLVLAAWRWGSWPERAAAMTFAVFFTLPNVVMRLAFDEGLLFEQSGFIYPILDIVALASFVIIAVNANRNYPLWLAGFQVVAVGVHAVRGIVDAVTPIAYAVMAIAPSYFQLAMLAIGVFRHLKRREKHGEYRDWRLQRRDIDFSALIREQS